MALPDYELLEQLLDDLATPLARYHTARVRIARALGAKNMRGLEPALRERDKQLSDVDALIAQYVAAAAVDYGPSEPTQEDLQRGFDPETMIMSADGSVER